MRSSDAAPISSLFSISARYSLDQVLGGDVVTASYLGSAPTAGTLEITSYGPEGDVEGTFTFDARLSRSTSAPVLRFENGWFRAPVVVRQ